MKGPRAVSNIDGQNHIPLLHSISPNCRGPSFRDTLTSTTGGMLTMLSRYVVCNLSVNGRAPFRGVKDREIEVLSTECGKRAAPASISHPQRKRSIGELAVPGTWREPFAPSVIERVNMETGIRYDLISFSPDSVSYSNFLLRRLRGPPMPALILSSALA